MSRRLPHYIKYERRRTGFSQADVAFLLGANAVTKVSRYERGKHLPTLRVALAYEAMLGVPVAELFPVTMTAARRDLLRRARSYAAAGAKLQPNARNIRRQRSLEKLLA
jgi:transcriptional regulator with XRE-family HTH domain